MARTLLQISEVDATSDFASVLARVRAGAEIVIESGYLAVAVIHPPLRGNLDGVALSIRILRCGILVRLVAWHRLRPSRS